MAKFHINAKGVPSVCKATKGNCPFGGVDGTDNHFNNIEDADKYVTEINEAKYGVLPKSVYDIGTQIAVIKGPIDPSKFVPPTGNQGNNKPNSGGFWTSSQGDDGESAWTKFTRKVMFYRTKKERVTWDIATITISPEARVLTIDTAEDYQKVIEKYKEPKDKYKGKFRFIVTNFGPDEVLDYDLLMKDYDAIRITENALKENPKEFNHWSCESTVWFNLNQFDSIEYLEKGYKEKKLY